MLIDSKSFVFKLALVALAGIVLAGAFFVFRPRSASGIPPGVAVQGFRIVRTYLYRSKDGQKTITGAILTPPNTRVDKGYVRLKTYDSEGAILGFALAPVDAVASGKENSFDIPVGEDVEGFSFIDVIKSE